MDKLQEICARKRDHVDYKKSMRSLEDLKYMIADTPSPAGFLRALNTTRDAALIAEVKKASPSKGIIRTDFDPVKIAKTYETAGASCLSVLTDEPYFQGHDTYLQQIKDAVDIPVLRKDFMIDPYQIYESRALGADCILLIMAALNDHSARNLYQTALDLRLDILVEVHDLQELERAILLNPMIIGVNNRNLKTMDIDLNTSFDLLMSIPPSVCKISESGIVTNDDINRLHKAGYKAFLVGESLMLQDNIEQAVHDLMGR